MSTSAMVYEINDSNVRAVYVHWDGGKVLNKCLKDHYVGNAEKLNELFSDGYVSDLHSDEIIRRNNEAKIIIESIDELSLIIESRDYVDYIHVIDGANVIEYNLEKLSIMNVSKKIQKLAKTVLPN